MEPGHFEKAPASTGFRAVTGDAAGDDSDQYRSYFPAFMDFAQLWECRQPKLVMY
jgi:hypothetical protein